MFIFLLACIFPYQAFSTVSVLDKGVVPLESNSVGIQFFVDIENEDRSEECLVHTWTKMCCLTDSEMEDCDTMHVYNPKFTIVKPRDRETLIHIYPTLYQHDQMGFCDFVIDSKCGRTVRHVREVANIPFDTRVPSGKSVPELLQHYVNDKERDECSFIDEDTLDSCRPINCDQKYTESRPFYDAQLSKCVAAVTCQGTIEKDLPDIVYVPKSNICRNLDRPLTVEDILELSKGLAVTTTWKPLLQENNIKLQIKSNCSTISQNLFLLKDLMLGKLCPMLNIDTSDYNLCFKLALIKIATCTVIACALLLGIICCVNVLCWIGNIYREGKLRCFWACVKSKFKKNLTQDASCCQYNVSRVNDDVKNSLLRQVIVRDIPMELRESMVDICDRMDRDILWKKRYREDEIGSIITLAQEDETSETSSISDDEEEQEEQEELHH